MKQKCQRLCPAISLKLGAIWCLLRVIFTWVQQLWKETVDHRSVKAQVHRQCWPFLKQQWQLFIAFSSPHMPSTLNPGTYTIRIQVLRETAYPMTLVLLWPLLEFHLKENTHYLHFKSTNWKKKKKAQMMFLCTVWITYQGSQAAPLPIERGTWWNFS